MSRKHLFQRPKPQEGHRRTRHSILAFPWGWMERVPLRWPGRASGGLDPSLSSGPVQGRRRRTAGICLCSCTGPGPTVLQTQPFAPTEASPIRPASSDHWVLGGGFWGESAEAAATPLLFLPDTVGRSPPTAWPDLLPAAPVWRGRGPLGDGEAGVWVGDKLEHSSQARQPCLGGSRRSAVHSVHPTPPAVRLVARLGARFWKAGTWPPCFSL